MPTQTPHPEPSPSLRWVPGARGILAASSDGRLIRFRKTHARTNKPAFYTITPSGTDDQVALKGTSRPAQYWICLAFNGQPPDPSARVEFKDGNRANFAPHNLAWRMSRATAITHGHNLTTQHLTKREGFRRVPGTDPTEYYTSSTGHLYRAPKSAKPKRIRGSLTRRGTCYAVTVSLPTTEAGKVTLPLVELIADMWLPPRPTPYHRAIQIDPRDPWNTSPHNLTWSTTQRAQAIRHDFSPNSTHSLPGSSIATHDTLQHSATRAAMAAHDRAIQTATQTREALRAEGARRVITFPSSLAWITPAGECLIIDPETGRPRYILPDPATGNVAPAPHVTIHLPTAVADAYYGTPYAPNLPDLCPLNYRVGTQTGSYHDCSPAQLIYRQVTGSTLREVYKFE